MCPPKPFGMVARPRVVVVWKGQEDFHDGVCNHRVDLEWIALADNLAQR
jgi:hypothetical protein